MINSYKYNKHRGLNICLAISFIFFALAVIIYNTNPILSFLKKNNNFLYILIDEIILKQEMFQKTFPNIIRMINNQNIVEYSLVLPSIISGVIILLNGKNKLVIIQIKTLLHYTNKWFWVQSLLSLGLLAFSYTYNSCTPCNRYDVVIFLSTTSLSIYLIYALFYLIRFNNDQSYYVREICGCIIKLSKFSHPYSCFKKSSTSSYNKYIYHLFPNLPDNHNKIAPDIEILVYLLSALKIAPYSRKKTKYKKILRDYFEKVVIPITTRIRRTYHNQESEFLHVFYERISSIRVPNSCYQSYLENYIIIVLQEFIIECEMKSNNNAAIEIIQSDLTKYRSIVKNSFEELYDAQYIHDVYIWNLSQISILNYSEYYQYEYNYMKKRCLFLHEGTQKTLRIKNFLAMEVENIP